MKYLLKNKIAEKLTEKLAKKKPKDTIQDFLARRVEHTNELSAKDLEEMFNKNRALIEERKCTT